MAALKGKKTKAIPAQARVEEEGAGIITSMLKTFMNGKEEGGAERAARLTENLWKLAMQDDNMSVKLAATKEILDRVDGTVIARKQIVSTRLEGIVYLPNAIAIQTAEASPAAAAPAPTAGRESDEDE